MATRKARETIHAEQLRLVLADLPRDHGRGTRQTLPKTTARELSDFGDVRVASRQQIWARLSRQILQTLRRHPDSRQCYHQPQPAHVPFPDLAADHLRLGGFRAIRGSSAGGQQQRADHDDDSRGEQADQNQGRGRNGLMLHERESDGWVLEVEGMVVWLELGESVTDQGDNAAACQHITYLGSQGLRGHIHDKCPVDHIGQHQHL